MPDGRGATDGAPASPGIDDRYRAIFEDSPISIWEEDFSAVKLRLDELRLLGVDDFGAYFDAHPEEVAALAGLVCVQDVNRTSVRMLGAASKADLARRLPPYFSPGTMGVFCEELKALAAGETRFRAEAPIRTPAGDDLTVDLTLVVLPGSEQTLQRVAVSFVDITAHVLYRERVALLTYALDSVHESAFLIDAGMNVRYVNQQACRSLGYSEDELLGMRPGDFDPWFTSDDWLERRSALKREGQISFETVHRASDGRLFPVAVRTHYFEHRGEGFALSLARDISERKRAEETLQSIAQGVSAETGDGYLRTLTLSLARALEVDIAIVAELDGVDGAVARIVARVDSGRFSAGAVYDTEYAPCRSPARGVACSYPSGVAQRFPNSPMLARLGVESYVGTPLFDSSGQVVGLMCAMHRAPLEDVTRVESALRIYAARAAAELENRRAAEQLRRSEERYRALVEAAPDAIMVLAAGELSYLEVNANACRLFGLARESFRGLTPLDLSPELQPGGWRSEVQARTFFDRAAGGNPQQFEWVHRRMDGSTFHAEVRLTRMGPADGDPIRCSVLDISARKQAEEALRRNERILQATALVAERFLRSTNWELHIDQVLAQVGMAADVSRVYIFEASRTTDGTVLASQRWEWAAPGVEAQIGNPDLQDLPMAEAGFGRWVAELETGRPVIGDVCDFPEVERGILDPQGILSLMVAPIFVDDRMWGFIGFDSCDARRVWSSTEVGSLSTTAHILGGALQRKRADEALQRNERRLSAAISATADAIWEMDLRSQELYFSPRWYAMLGLPPGAGRLTLDDWAALCHPDDAGPRAERALADACEPGSAGFHGEFRLRHADGAWVWHLVRGNVVERDAAGGAVLLSGTCTDVTERRRAEDERERLQSQLTQAQKMESVGRLAGGIAHDFNSMLTVILGRSELAMRLIEPNSPLQKSLEVIRGAAERSASLTRQLLAFARRQAVAPRVVDLNETIEGMLNMLRHLIKESVELCWRPRRDLWLVRVDPIQVDQVLANLTSNARDAIDGVGRITIDLQNAVVDARKGDGDTEVQAGEYVALSVSDTGAGIPPGDIQHIFEPFYTTKGLGAGTGLGLATVYGIARQNNGFIEVVSEPGCGATFRVYFPRHTHAPAAGADRPTSSATGGGETILLVEDNAAILELGRMILQQYGYVVLAADTPAKALLLSESHAGRIDLLLTDVVMPGMTGRDLSEAMAARRPRSRVLYMSGYTADVIAREGVIDESVNFIQKPFTVEGLGRKVRDVLDQPSAPAT